MWNMDRIPTPLNQSLKKSIMPIYLMLRLIAIYNVKSEFLGGEMLFRTEKMIKVKKGCLLSRHFSEILIVLYRVSLLGEIESH